jgi:hypothetical protein
MYTLDFRRIPVGKYLNILKTRELLPGRRVLLNGIDLNFDKITGAGVCSLYEFKNRLSTPAKLSAFSAETLIPESYLVILKRELGSLEQKPVPLSEFPGIGEVLLSALLEKGIKTSRDFFESGGEESRELCCLCELVRINGVGPAAARTMYESGYKSVADVAGADAGELLAKITEVNDTRQYYHAKLGVKDMQFAIDAAKLLLELETNRDKP